MYEPSASASSSTGGLRLLKAWSGRYSMKAACWRFHQPQTPRQRVFRRLLPTYPGRRARQIAAVPPVEDPARMAGSGWRTTSPTGRHLCFVQSWLLSGGARHLQEPGVLAPPAAVGHAPCAALVRRDLAFNALAQRVTILPRGVAGKCTTSPTPWSPGRSPGSASAKIEPRNPVKPLILLFLLVGGTGIEPVTPAV